MSILLAAAFLAAPAHVEFRPDLFFQGRTRGRGTVHKLFSGPPAALAVESVGRIDPDGTLVLDQAIRIDGKPSARSFRIRRAANGGWVGSLTDAAGPVRARVAGDALLLDYTMKGGTLRMSQTLTIQPGGRTLLNRGRVTLLGVQVALVDETIEKLD